MTIDYSNLIADTESNADLDRIIEQVDAEVIAWTADYHAAGKRGGELSDSDVAAAVATRWARYVLACRS